MAPAAAAAGADAAAPAAMAAAEAQSAEVCWSGRCLQPATVGVCSLG
jgi:hypothetical protein